MRSTRVLIARALGVDAVSSSLKMMLVFLHVLYLVLWSTEVNAERRNLSEIRYHFTPCGAVGTSGPSYSECVKYYTSLNSPITRDGVLTDAYSGNFAGSQSFRPPRNTTWNITIAGAAGGRGLCNTEFGRGLVQYIQSTSLSTEYDYIILVGQKGLGPCDTSQPDPGHMLCMDPPQTYNDTFTCGLIFQEWLNNISISTNEPVGIFIEEYIGGAGGGGASYVGNKGKKFNGLYDTILGISAGGGGTSVQLNYSIIRHDFPNNFINVTLSDIDIYRQYIDAKPTPLDDITYSEFGATGFKFFADVQAGSGGGFSESSFTVISLEDGRGLNMSERFAEGGTHCARIEMLVPKQLKEAVGGFGAGGGGCREGGGGGGFTGGTVFEITAYSPGSGGYSFNNFSVDYSVDQYSFNEGDGYVDIVAADCGCVYECLVYEEDDQFECICPNDTQLAPDMNDCYYSDVRSVVTSIMATDPEEAIILNGISFGNSSCIFSVDVHLNTTEMSEKQNADSEGGLCILMFVGEDNNVVLVTGPIRVSGRVTLSQLSDNGTLTGYTSFLDSPVFVSGAVLASTAECTINEIITFNTSIQGTENQDEVNFTKLGIDLYNMSHPTNVVIRELLEISEDDNGMRETTEDFFSVEIIAAFAIAVLLSVIVLVVISTLIVKRCKRSKLAVVRNEATVFDLTNTQTQCSIELQINLGYEVLYFEDDDISLSGRQFTSRYGVNGTHFDFTDFNRSRSNMKITDWEYPRSNLVFLRDLGEGQFGKVMLMKAKNIAGCSGSIPVAVKTLSSRDLNVIQKFMEEVELMKRFTHPNIVGLLGVCGVNAADDSAPLMILEYMPFGDLRGFLEAHRPTQKQPVSLISEKHFYNFAIDVAEALNFLSSHKYVHRDIAARNCLVGANLQIKIADFGLARGVYDKDYYRVAGQTFLPVRWLAPECLLYGIFTTASDVWAYGVLLWEITTYGMMPLNNFEAQEIVNMAQNGLLRHLRPAACPKAMYSVLRKCHEQNQAKRPSFSDVIHLLGTVQKKKGTH